MITIQDVRAEIKAQNLDIFGICEVLQKYGSEEDPIIYRGNETTPRDLAYHLAAGTPALSVRISFWGDKKGGGFGLRRNSNFACMLQDRMNMREQKEREKKRQERKPVVRYIVTWKVWNGVESCGRSEYSSRKKEFERRTEAKTFFVEMKQTGHTNVQLRKMTDELLE